MADSPETRDTGSAATANPEVAYDPERLGEPGQSGVPATDQRPTNEEGDGKNISADVHIPGPYPSGHADPTAEPAAEPEPTKETRDATSLGEVAHGMGSMVVNEEAARAGAGRPSTDYPQSPQEAVQKLKEESHPGGTPEDADVGTGRNKGAGLPPGSVDRGHDTPQTPAT